MLTTARGAEDGYSLRTYESGLEYEIGGSPRADDLAAVFLREKWAEPIVLGPVLIGVPALVVDSEAAVRSAVDEVVAEVPPPHPGRRRR
jgi:hypothetical protein